VVSFTPGPLYSRYPLSDGPGSSVGIATDYGLDGPGSSLGGDEIFQPVQTGPVAHPASCNVGTGSFPGEKCGRCVLLTTQPLLVPRSWKSRAIPLPTVWAHRACDGKTLPLPLPIKWDAVWAHSRSGRFGEENSLPHVCSRIAIFFLTARSLVTADLDRQYEDE